MQKFYFKVRTISLPLERYQHISIHKVNLEKCLYGGNECYENSVVDMQLLKLQIVVCVSNECQLNPKQMQK